jgi:hypothetical protein
MLVYLESASWQIVATWLLLSDPDLAGGLGAQISE